MGSRFQTEILLLILGVIGLLLMFGCYIGQNSNDPTKTQFLKKYKQVKPYLVLKRGRKGAQERWDEALVA